MDLRLHLSALIATAASLIAACGFETPRQTAAAAPASVTCGEIAYSPRRPPHWVHPSQNFYAPDAPDAPTLDDLEHLLLADNAVVVTYPTDAPRVTRERLREWVTTQVAAVVVADRSPDAPPVQAKIATALLTCDGVDPEQLSAFAAKRGSGQVNPHPDEG